MNPTNLCEKCGKPEKGYSVTETNAKLRKVAKGPARREVESFICSRCVVNKATKEIESVSNKARGNMVGTGSLHPPRSAHNTIGAESAAQ